MNASPLDRLRWTAAVVADPMIGDRAKAIAAVLAFILNAKTGTTFVSMATLARLVGKCERSARMSVRELQAAGWLQCRRSRGRVTNVYAPVFAMSSSYNPFPSEFQEEVAGETRHGDAELSPSTRQTVAGSKHANPASSYLQPGKAKPPTRQEDAAEQGNKINIASGSAPLKAHATAKKSKKLTPEEGAIRAAEFARIRARVGQLENPEVVPIQLNRPSELSVQTGTVR